MKSKLSTAFFLLMIFHLGTTSLSFGQLIGTKPIKGFTSASDIQQLRDHSETKGFIEIGDAYSKARGVTIFSAMNALNNRAKKKLLEEAAIRGATHVWIENKLPDDVGVFGRLVSYHAVLYRHPDVQMDLITVKQAFVDNDLRSASRMVINRNAFGAKYTIAENLSLIQVDPETDIFEKNGRIFVEIKIRKSSAEVVSTKKEYEVIALDDESIMLSEELEENKKYAAHLFKLSKKK